MYLYVDIRNIRLNIFYLFLHMNFNDMFPKHDDKKTNVRDQKLDRDTLPTSDIHPQHPQHLSRQRPHTTNSIGPESSKCLRTGYFRTIIRSEATAAESSGSLSELGWFLVLLRNPLLPAPAAACGNSTGRSHASAGHTHPRRFGEDSSVPNPLA